MHWPVQTVSMMNDDTKLHCNNILVATLCMHANSPLTETTP